MDLATADLALLPAPVAGTHLCAQARPAWRGRLCTESAAGLVHAVALHRRVDELSGEPELAVCGAIVAVQGGRWPAEATAATCPECAAALAG